MSTHKKEPNPTLPDMRFRQSLYFYQEQFSQLPAADESSSAGDYHAAFVGPAWLRAGCAWSMPFIGLPGWRGKRLSGKGKAANLCRALCIRSDDESSVLQERCVMNVQADRSVTDGRPVLSLNYTEPSTPWLLRHFRDELRQWDENTILAYAVIRLPWLNRFMKPICLPFVLSRHSSG